MVITDEQGNEFHAVPGTAVVKMFGEPVGTLAVTGDVDAFLKNWEAERLAFLKAHAFDVIQREARRYDALADEFDTEFAALQEKKETLEKWIAEEKKGIIGSEAEVEKEKVEIAELLASLRETQFLLERVHYRLVTLKDLHAQGIGDGDIRKGLTTKEFFERFESDRAALELRMADVRYVTKLFVRRNKGLDPTAVADLRLFYERRLAHLKKLEHKKPAKRKPKRESEIDLQENIELVHYELPGCQYCRLQNTQLPARVGSFRA